MKLAFVRTGWPVLTGDFTPKSFSGKQYGFEISVSEIMQSDTGKLLRNLGLVLDSPDAEGGMILNPPFSNRIN